MAPTTDHLVGLLLGAEEDWPHAFEALARRLGVLRAPDGGQHTLDTERVHDRAVQPARQGPPRRWSSTGSPTGTTTRASG